MNDLNRALHELAEVPGPPNMADQALKNAKRKRITFAAGAALAAVAVISVPFLLRLQISGRPMEMAAPAASPKTVQSGATGCAGAPQIKPDVKEVAQKDWPSYVRLAIERLPQRTDYVMQSGTARICSDGGAYAVINLGPRRENGHLTVTLDRVERVPVKCADLKPADGVPAEPTSKLLICEEGLNGIKLVYAVETNSTYRVHAIYADGRHVTMESLPALGETPVISVEDLKKVVTDPAMAALFG